MYTATRSIENNNVYHFNSFQPLLRTPALDESHLYVSSSSPVEAALTTNSTRLAESNSTLSTTAAAMMLDHHGEMEPDISEFRMRAVMIFTYLGFAFLTLVLFVMFVLSTYWSLAESCSKSTDKNESEAKKGGRKSAPSAGGCCSIEESEPSTSNGVGITLNGNLKKGKKCSSPKSSQYNDTGHDDEDNASCELLEWDRQTQVVEMEEL